MFIFITISLGATVHPTNYPSQAPTYSLKYAKHFTYKYYTKTSVAYKSVPNSFTYGAYYYKGLAVDGTCDAWSNFAASVMQLPFDNLRFSQLTLNVENYDFDTKRTTNITAVCSTPGPVKAITTHLQAGTTFSVNCEATQWRMFPCNGKMVRFFKSIHKI